MDLLLLLASIQLLLLFNAFAITGFAYATLPEMVLEKLRTWGEKHLPWYLQKPLYDCPGCMASLHSTYFYIPFAILVDYRLLLCYPVYILTLSGMSMLVFRLVDSLQCE